MAMSFDGSNDTTHRQCQRRNDNRGSDQFGLAADDQDNRQ